MKKSNQQKGDFKEHKESARHDARSKSTMPQKPNPDQMHSGFQFGSNPMHEDGFEKRMIMQEKLERDLARERYVAGIQGTDGGKKPYECYNVNN